MAHFNRCLALPAALAARGVRLRGESDLDRPFLEGLYVASRWEELACTNWRDEEKHAFLASQFAFQHQHYATYYHDADFGVVECDEAPVGRLYLFRGTFDVRIVDIMLLPASRNAGLGSALLLAIRDEAGSDGRTVSIHVEKFNPALRLYHRLGFQPVSEDEVYRLMEWTPRSPATTPATADLSGDQTRGYPMTFPNTLEEYQPHVGSDFVVTLADGGAYTLTLRDARPLKAHHVPGRSRDPFLLVFAGPITNGYLPQQIHSMAHAVLGRFEIFIAPLGAKQDVMEYQSVFN
ncbi:MAG: GNAT family N-acetyltransferase [Rhodospirillaceae bacterium]